MKLKKSRRPTCGALAKAVLKWWEEHRSDTTRIDEDEDNVFDQEPQFVALARALTPKTTKPTKSRRKR